MHFKQLKFNPDEFDMINVPEGIITGNMSRRMALDRNYDRLTPIQQSPRSDSMKSMMLNN